MVRPREWRGSVRNRLLWMLLAELATVASALGAFAFLRKLAQRVPNSTVARICGYILLAPAISSARVSPSRFRVGSAVPRISRRVPVGTTISFGLSEAAGVTLAFARPTQPGDGLP